jgi:hypothetical protein
MVQVPPNDVDEILLETLIVRDIESASSRSTASVNVDAFERNVVASLLV